MKVARALTFACVVAAVVIASACAFGWYAEKADIDRRQVEAEERFDANIAKWKEEAAAKASSQPDE